MATATGWGLGGGGREIILLEDYVYMCVLGGGVVADLPGPKSVWINMSDSQRLPEPT